MKELFTLFDKLFHEENEKKIDKMEQDFFNKAKEIFNNSSVKSLHDLSFNEIWFIISSFYHGDFFLDSNDVQNFYNPENKMLVLDCVMKLKLKKILDSVPLAPEEIAMGIYYCFAFNKDFLQSMFKELGYGEVIIQENDVSKQNAPVKKREERSSTSLKRYEDIKNVKLFFDEDVEKQLKRVENVMSKENISLVFERLKEKNSMRGICISFYGDSGTGKTESIYQLARKTKHDIYTLNIADSESKWVGEQANLINAAFKNYNKIVDNIANIENIPIMLINEADSIFSKRIENDTSASNEKNKLVAELLDNIENTKGIVIVTTNRFDNFDAAMIRRFLLKVEFKAPSKEVQQKIWKNRLNNLKPKEIRSITEDFNLTGAEIDNIITKSDLDYIINGTEANYENILQIIKENNEEESSHTIGFAIGD